MVGILSPYRSSIARTNPLVVLRMAVRGRARLTGLNRGDFLVFAFIFELVQRYFDDRDFDFNID